jgi:imidazolonepropionase-like amidohydrolase
MIIRNLRLLFASLLILSFTAIISAQTRTDVYAITNARIVTVSDKTIERGTVVVRDGLIESVGAGVRIPADARVIDGNGLTVYPGFFDALTNLGIPARTPQRGGQNAPNQPVSNSNYPDVLQPENTAFEELKAGEDQFEKQRNAGFTTALTVGSDGIFQGQSAVINLAGDTVSGMVIKSPFAQHVMFRTNSGGNYPSSLMGTFSALRQMFLDASRLQEMRKMYAANPKGMKRPDSDASLDALMPVINGQIPIVMNADSEREINRVLDLTEEFKLKTIVAGGTEAWKTAARLKQLNVPVLLSVDFPKRTTAVNADADPEPLQILRLRVEAPKNPARLTNAGVRYAFQSGALKNMADFVKNANTAVENGLSKDAAIRAMTLSAAEILGVSNQLGSIETGKIANLTVSRGDIFAKDTQLTHVFVDGKLFEQKEKPKAKPGDKPAAGQTGALMKVGGAYNISIEIPGQPLTGTLTLVQQNAELTGSLQTQFGTTNVEDGKVTADGFSFAGTVDFQGQTFEIFVKGTVEGNQINGTLTSPQGAIPFSGTKVP